MIPLRARRLLAAVLIGTGMLTLLAGAAAQDLPFSDSLAMAGRFWNAGPRGRLLNAPGLARDAVFAADAMRIASTWPPEMDAVLSVGPLVPSDVGERLRRKASYVLAPRRVFLVPGRGAEVKLLPSPAGVPPR
ncbi:MAG: hypothetical protein IPN03_12905 [Holophagales bacterium]|nr:hypothetical protein [Holophagales bacterium]